MYRGSLSVQACAADHAEMKYNTNSEAAVNHVKGCRPDNCHLLQGLTNNLMVGALCHQPEYRGFESRCHWIFQLT
jgi:hypothetical protein